MPLRFLHYADVENGYDDPERVGRLAGAIDARRDEATIVTGGGDNTAPGVLSLVTEGRQSLDFFEAVRPDADALGNHDFDHGPVALRRVVSASPQPWLAANVYESDAAAERFAGVEPWTVVEVGGHRVGLVGVANPETPTMNPAAESATFTDPVAAAADAVRSVRDRGVDCVAVLSHCGDDDPLARALDVTVVLGGHTHEARIGRVDGTLVTRPGANGTHLLEVTLDGSRATAERHPVADEPMDDEVAGALHDRMAETGLTETVASVAEPIVCDAVAVKCGESRVGNLVTDAYRWATGADVALHAPGGFRECPPLAGEATVFDLVGVTPFGNDLVTLDVDGATLRDALRQVALAHYPDVATWLMGHVSGVELVWDDATDELREARVGGDPLDPDGSYRVATSDYYVVSDHLFPALDPDDVVDRHGEQYDAIVEYARAEGVEPELEGRVRRPELDPDALPERDGPFSRGA
jgi:2',3'-cyclic-nucleotide 2'-phosphodiesterase (5'-nucleotidase family)